MIGNRLIAGKRRRFKLRLDAVDNEALLKAFTRRVFCKYTPTWLVFSGIYCAAFSSLAWTSALPFWKLYAIVQGQAAVVCLFIVTTLFLLRPFWWNLRLTAIITAMLAAVIVWYASHAALAGFSAVPFQGPLQATIFLLLNIESGVIFVWFFVLAERHHVLDNMLQDEKARRLIDEKRILAFQLKLLQAQIEPRFLFSILSEIVRLRDVDFQAARQMQSRFIHYLRLSLHKTRTDEITLADEMDLVQAYLDLLRVQTGDRLCCHLDFDRALADCSLPSMLLQPVVEAAARRRVRVENGNGHIEIRARKLGKVLQITVADSRPGAAAGGSPGAGLEHIGARIDTLYGAKGRFGVEGSRSTGLKVVIEVPIEQ